MTNDEKKSIRKVLKKSKKSLVDYKWIVTIVIITFIIAIIFTTISETIIPNVSIIFSILLTLIFIALGIVFDIIGVAVTSSDEAPFHSMASRKVKGAKCAVLLKKNADKVSSICNDVVGDICGIISGSTGAVIAITLSKNSSINSIVITVLVMAIISTLTIGGKAIGKGFAINKSNEILYSVAKAISIFIKK